MNKASMFFAFFLCVSQSATAQTIWCTAFSLVCMTAEEKAEARKKAMENCQNLANESYQEGLTEALVDRSIWQLNGHTSAQAYAAWRMQLAMNVCVNRSPELQD